MLFQVINNTDGTTLLPVTDGAYETIDMSATDQFMDRESGTFAIAFFSDADGLIPVTPSAGTATPEGDVIGAPQWLAPGGGDAVIDATKCIASPLASAYAVPTFIGPMFKGRVTLAGVTGALTCRATFWRK